MSRYENIKFILIAPKELRVPEYIISEVLEAKNIPYEEVESMEEVMSELDVLYMTRVQKERFFNEADYVRLKDTYIPVSYTHLCAADMMPDKKQTFG